MRWRRHDRMARLSIRAAAITELGIVSSESSNVRTRVDRNPTLSTTPSMPWIATCSPIRNPLSRLLRYVNTFASFGIAGVLGRLLARSAGLHEQALRWKLVEGPKFNNALATLDLAGRHAKLRWETAKLEPGDDFPGVVEIAAVDLV